jgi:hypothetical protein
MYLEFSSEAAAQYFTGGAGATLALQDRVINLPGDASTWCRRLQLTPDTRVPQEAGLSSCGKRSAEMTAKCWMSLHW